MKPISKAKKSGAELVMANFLPFFLGGGLTYFRPAHRCGKASLPLVGYSVSHSDVSFIPGLSGRDLQHDLDLDGGVSIPLAIRQPQVVCSSLMWA